MYQLPNGVDVRYVIDGGEGLGKVEDVTRSPAG
jgi:hypothetical protein